jgi:hypothetical protein
MRRMLGVELDGSTASEGSSLLTLGGPRPPLSALDPCRNGRVRASVVTSGLRRFGGTTGHRLSRSCSWVDAGGRFRLSSRSRGRRRRGSRRAATGVRNDRGARPKTVEDHDTRSCHRRPLTWGFSCVFPGSQHHAVPCRSARYGSRTEAVRLRSVGR